MKKVVMYTDGACRGNPGPGGWGAFFIYGEHMRELFGSENNTTNNRMELMACIKGLAELSEGCKVVLNTDSTYVLKGITEWMDNWKARGWKTAAKKPVKNVDLWQQLDKEIQRHQIDWHWVKGHSGNEGNDTADRLANQGVDRLNGQH